MVNPTNAITMRMIPFPGNATNIEAAMQLENHKQIKAMETRVDVTSS